MEFTATMLDRIIVDQLVDKSRGVIGIRRILPKAVVKHFDPPPLFIGAYACDWSNDRLQEEACSLGDALEDGLAKAFSIRPRQGWRPGFSDGPADARRGSQINA